MLLQQSPKCSINMVPMELIIMVSKNLTLKDKLYFADTCRSCRPIVSEKECLFACAQAGLSKQVSVSARTLAKLLVQCRKGISNWSHEQGVPKAGLNFSKVWSLAEAIQENVVVALHPAFDPCWSIFLCDTPSLEDVTLRVAPGLPKILLRDNRLYFHEFLSSPPLEEMRIHFSIDEGLRRNSSDVAFRMRNPGGITLGDFHQCLFRFLHQKPSLNMPLSKRMLEYLAPSRDRPSVETDDEATRVARGFFNARFSSNIALLDAHYILFDNHSRASDSALGCQMALISRYLELCVDLEDPELASLDHMDRLAHEDNSWGDPRYGLQNASRWTPEVEARIENYWAQMPVIVCRDRS